MFYNAKESGKRIAIQRKAKGLTQEQFAERINLSTSTLGRIERGLQPMSIDLLVEMACFYGVTLDYLVLGVEANPSEAKSEIDLAIATLMAAKQKL